MQRWCARGLSSGLPAVLERGLASSRFRVRDARDTRQRVFRAELVVRNVESKASTADEPVFRCQATDWFGASQAVGWWNVRSFLNEWSCGNVGFWRFSATMGIGSREIGRRLHLVPRVEVMPHHRSAERVETPPPRLLEPGSLVQIRSREEIEPTLDPTGRNKGLFFDRCEIPLLWQDLPIKTRGSGSSMRTPGSSFSSRATATSSTAWSAPGTAARASGFAGEPSTPGGERRGRACRRDTRRQIALKRRIQLLEQRTESEASSASERGRQSDRTRAGTPRTTSPGATSRVTTAPAPTSACAPTRIPPSTTAPEPIVAPRSTTVSRSFQSVSL